MSVRLAIEEQIFSGFGNYNEMESGYSIMDGVLKDDLLHLKAGQTISCAEIDMGNSRINIYVDNDDTEPTIEIPVVVDVGNAYVVE